MHSLSSSKQPTRLWQLPFKEQLRYRKGLSRATQCSLPCYRVAQPRSHPLHRVVLIQVQQLNRRRQQHNDQREKTHNLRDRDKAQYQDQIRVADPSVVAALEQEAQAAYDRWMLFIHRFNRGPADVLGGSPIADAAMQHSAYAASVSIQAASPELPQSEQQQRQEFAFVISDAPWPPSATIRATPRRPGAPSFALRLNH